MVGTEKAEEERGGGEQKEAAKLAATLVLAGLLWRGCRHRAYSGFLLTR
jgi:hypothetical protein